ncbi:hypothetical protein F4604DRAFT_1766839 [Suillus subluteus]|nr:hypothetical protein F4604DRAFT_1766839 [Suillus subluteus]
MPADRRTYLCSCYRKCGGTPIQVTRSVYRSHSRYRLEMDDPPSNIPMRHLVDGNAHIDEHDEENVCRDEGLEDEEHQVEGALAAEENRLNHTNVFNGHVGCFFTFEIVAYQFIRMVTLMICLHPSNKITPVNLRVEMLLVQLSRMSRTKMIPCRMSHLPLTLMKRFLKTTYIQMSRSMTFDARLPTYLLCRVPP